MFAILMICFPCCVLGLILTFVGFHVHDSLNKLPPSLHLFLLLLLFYFIWWKLNVDYPSTSNLRIFKRLWITHLLNVLLRLWTTHFLSKF